MADVIRYAPMPADEDPARSNIAPRRMSATEITEITTEVDLSTSGLHRQSRSNNGDEY